VRGGSKRKSRAEDFDEFTVRFAKAGTCAIASVGQGHFLRMAKVRSTRAKCFMCLDIHPLLFDRVFSVTLSQSLADSWMVNKDIKDLTISTTSALYSVLSAITVMLAASALCDYQLTTSSHEGFSVYPCVCDRRSHDCPKCCWDTVPSIKTQTVSNTAAASQSRV
jgi:hypothetical protein